MKDAPQIHSLKNHFLIAMPGLQDPYFMNSVVFIQAHSDEGATGFIVNKPTNVSVGDVLERLKLDSKKENLAEKSTLLGGPVSQEQVFLLTRDKNTTTPEAIELSYSEESLALVVADDSSQDAIFFLGYSSWEPGQLEQEVAANGWLIVPYNSELLFHVPYMIRYDAAASLIGVDMQNLSSDVGHA